MSAVAELDRQASPSPDGPPPSDGEATPSEPPPGAEPSEEQMLDVLYEVLAQGPAPKSKLTREIVEQFLHQHARSKKPVAEMVAFFEEHGLPLQPEEDGTDAELRELATGLQRDRSSLVPGYQFAEPEEPATLPPATVEAIRREAQTGDEGANTGKHAAVVVTAAPAKPLHWGVWAGAAAAVFALLGGLGVSYWRASHLEQRLEHARMQQKSTDVALTKLEQRAETLQGELKQSEQDRKVQQTRFQEELAQQAKQRATEGAAVEKMLGVRYTKLRQKLENEQNAPTVQPAPPVQATK